MGHPRSDTPMQVGNSTFDDIMNIEIHQKFSNSISILFYWMKDRVKQKHFDAFWKAGVNNLGGYFNKHHSPAHQKIIIPIYLQYPNILYASASVCYYK